MDKKTHKALLTYASNIYCFQGDEGMAFRRVSEDFGYKTAEKVMIIHNTNTLRKNPSDRG